MIHQAYDSKYKRRYRSLEGRKSDKRVTPDAFYNITRKQTNLVDDRIDKLKAIRA